MKPLNTFKECFFWAVLLLLRIEERILVALVFSIKKLSRPAREPKGWSLNTGLNRGRMEMLNQLTCQIPGFIDFKKAKDLNSVGRLFDLIKDECERYFIIGGYAYELRLGVVADQKYHKDVDVVLVCADVPNLVSILEQDGWHCERRYDFAYAIRKGLDRIDLFFWQWVDENFAEFRVDAQRLSAPRSALEHDLVTVHGVACRIANQEYIQSIYPAINSPVSRANVAKILSCNEAKFVADDYSKGQMRSSSAYVGD